MKKIIKLTLAVILGVCSADAAVRDANTIQRGDTNNTQKTIANTRGQDTTARSTTQRTVQRNTKSAAPHRQNTVSARTATPTTTARTTLANRPRAIQKIPSARFSTNSKNTKNSARATITLNAPQSNTFGTGYNTCRDAYFTCMDQFCGTANDTYRRCVCSSKLSTVQERERALNQSSNHLQDFHSLNMAVIDKSAKEVNAMISASAGELFQSTAKDTSAAALQLSGINDVLSKSKTKSLSTQGTLDIAGDINSIWATTDLTGGVNIANLSGEALYNAVHAQCAELTIDKCPDKSTQNMVTSAYGMYIENDCSIVLNGLDKKLIDANGAIRATEREMNLARLDNYDAHNSLSINDCLSSVRNNITQDTACGKDYIHCLDITGLYLSYDTGEPIYSPNFYQLESQTSLAGDILTNQTNRLLIAKLNSLRPYANTSLDTCRDLADNVWDEFLRQAITEIYQGQHDRIRLVKNECLNVVNECYDEQTQSLKDFSNTDEQLLLGARLELAEQMCQEKLNTCSNLYGGGSHGMQALLTAMHSATDLQIGLQCRDALLNFAKNMCAVPGNDTLHVYPYTCRVYAPGSQQYATIAKCNQDTTSVTPYTDPTIGDDTSAKKTQADYTDCIKHPADVNQCETEKAERPEPETDPYHNYTCGKIYTSCPAGSYMAGPSGTDYNGTPVAGNTCIIGQNYLCTYPGGTAAPICAYTSCATGYYMQYNGKANSTPQVGNTCEPCPSGYYCYGETAAPTENTTTEEGTPTETNECGTDYIGSLYQKLVRYALQTCVRPSQSSDVLPTNILQDVNIVMTQLHTDMANALSQECERLGGIWVDSVWVDKVPNKTCCAYGTCITNEDGVERITDGCHDITGDPIHATFYKETAANTQWGYCAEQK